MSYNSSLIVRTLLTQSQSQPMPTYTPASNWCDPSNGKWVHESVARHCRWESRNRRSFPAWCCIPVSQSTVVNRSERTSPGAALAISRRQVGYRDIGPHTAASGASSGRHEVTDAAPWTCCSTRCASLPPRSSSLGPGCRNGSRGWAVSRRLPTSARRSRWTLVPWRTSLVHRQAESAAISISGRWQTLAAMSTTWCVSPSAASQSLRFRIPEQVLPPARDGRGLVENERNSPSRRCGERLDARRWLPPARSRWRMSCCSRCHRTRWSTQNGWLWTVHCT